VVLTTKLILMGPLLSGQAAVVVVVRNSDGQPLLTSHGDRFFTARTQKKWNSAGVEKLKVQSQDRSMAWPLIGEAIHVGRHLHRLETSRISREQNKVAHELEHLAFSLRGNRVYLSLFHECARLLGYFFKLL
jgi:UDP-2,3-diacylglucosamine pyrophosphatase LpxH